VRQISARYYLVSSIVGESYLHDRGTSEAITPP
jgi:hypothetical protein